MIQLRVGGWVCKAQRGAGAVRNFVVTASPSSQRLPRPRSETCCSLTVRGGQILLKLAKAPFVWSGLVKGTSKEQQVTF